MKILVIIKLNIKQYKIKYLKRMIILFINYVKVFNLPLDLYKYEYIITYDFECRFNNIE